MKSIIAISLFLAVAFATEWEDPEFDGLYEIENRIVGGELARPSQFPYQVRLHLQKRINGIMMTSLCGGAIVSDKVIVTAAHCLDGALSGTVFMGVTNFEAAESTRTVMKLGLQNFIVHEKYNNMLYKNDIALVTLPAAVRFNDAIQPIRLPKRSLTDLDGIVGVISGFGNTGDNMGPSNTLRFVERGILPAGVCTAVFKFAFIPDTNICLDGSSKKSACPGDSGGPLAITEADGIKTLVGVTSFGRRTCAKDFPSVYTRITAYLDWINKHTGIAVQY